MSVHTIYILVSNFTFLSIFFFFNHVGVENTPLGLRIYLKMFRDIHILIMYTNVSDTALYTAEYICFTNDVSSNRACARISR